MLGSVEPRLWTRPLRELNEYTSYGYDVIEFARDVLGQPLDPWQEWVTIHAGELLPDGRPRFRKVLVLVSRQQGKTHLLKVLTLFWLYVEHQPLVLGTSTNLSVAKEAWQAACDLAQGNEWLKAEGAHRAGQTGAETLSTAAGCRYKIAASNRKGGRGLTINRLVMDELREHATWDAWNAAVPATNAVNDAQIWMLSNQGDDTGIVLDDVRASALHYIDTGEGDDRLGIFEYSAPDGADPEDLHALAQANPQAGRRMDWSTLLGEARRAKTSPDPAALASFRTEYMCQRVAMLNPGIDTQAWEECGDSQHTPRYLHDAAIAATLNLCVDVSQDGSHASLVGAAYRAGILHVGVIEVWEGSDCTARLRAELPTLVEQIKPDAGRLRIGWLPTGPAAAIAAAIQPPDTGRKAGHHIGVDWIEITADTTKICMGLADVVRNRELRHVGDQMLTAHVRAVQKVDRGDSWVFGRKQSAGPIDGAYALAGAVHLARKQGSRGPVTVA